MRILLVEDDEMLAKATAAGLRSDFAVDHVASAEDAELSLSTTGYDLLVLDINLPGKSGLQMLADIRAKGKDIPCLLLTARDAVRHRVEGLNAGADDYLVKPFDLDELIARAGALIRRSKGHASTVMRWHDITFDVSAKRTEKNGQPVALSARETAILEVLFSNMGKLVSKSQIESHIYDWGSEDIGSNTIEVHISALRRKLGKEFVKTVRNMGYIVEP